MSTRIHQAHVEIHLTDLCCDAIIGIYPFERAHRQRLELNLCLGLPAEDYWACAESGDLSCSINYAEVKALCLFISQEGHFRLLETLTATLARALFLNRSPYAPSPRSLRLQASKPDVLGGEARPAVSLALSDTEPPALLSTKRRLTWERRAVEQTTLNEASSSPKRLTHEPGALIVLCDAPEVYVAYLRAHPHQLSALTLVPNGATLLMSGKWFGVNGAPTAPNAPPDALTLGQVVSGAQYKELWCLEGGEAITVLRAPEPAERSVL